MSRREPEAAPTTQEPEPAAAREAHHPAPADQTGRPSMIHAGADWFTYRRCPVDASVPGAPCYSLHSYVRNGQTGGHAQKLDEPHRARLIRQPRYHHFHGTRDEYMCLACRVDTERQRRAALAAAAR